MKFRSKALRFLIGDIRDKDILDTAMDGIDYVAHLASIVGDPACKLNSDLAIKTNFESSKNLLEKSKNSEVSKFIFASTCSNYGKMDDPEAYVDENSRLAPVSLYAELKVKFEKYMSISTLLILNVFYKN